MYTFLYFVVYLEFEFPLKKSIFSANVDYRDGSRFSEYLIS